MNKIVLIIILSVIGSYINAQDIIVLISGEQRSVIVKKVGLTTVDYVRFDNQQGAIYEVSKGDVRKIIYQNGVEENFQEQSNIKSESAAPIPATGEVIDDRDGISYKYVVIGKQIWMADNLKFKIGGSKCLIADENDCDKCGRYYNYEEAIKACPAGWHLPNDDEWIDLEIEVGMNESEASKSGWRGTKPGQAPELLRGGKTGLDLTMCGFISSSNSDILVLKEKDIESYKVDGYYWTATADGIFAYYRQFSSRFSINRGGDFQNKGFPIRCIKD
jgi:uncharacterized protein (TIGR02145 family)